MSFAIEPGYQATVTIKDANHTVLYSKKFDTRGEYKGFKNQAKSVKGYSLVDSVITPLRSDTLKNFAKDLFAPTYFHFTSKIHNTALKVFTSLFALALDVASLPIRIITAPFRVAEMRKNPQQANHPIIELIKDRPEATQALQDKVVFVTYETVRTDVQEPAKASQPKKATKIIKTVTKRVALQQLPGGIISNKTYEKDTMRATEREGGFWHVKSRVQDSSIFYKSIAYKGGDFTFAEYESETKPNSSSYRFALLKA